MTVRKAGEMIAVRLTVENDADEASEVLRRSIIELCAADHRDDPEVLEGWLKNKTAEQFRQWLQSPESVVVVAVDASGTICGVGGAHSKGEITLNYVSPDHRFQGVSSAILEWLERWLQARGLRTASLLSTRTARRFYASKGYRADAPEVSSQGVGGQPMIKIFATQPGRDDGR